MRETSSPGPYGLRELRSVSIDMRLVEEYIEVFSRFVISFMADMFSQVGVTQITCLTGMLFKCLVSEMTCLLSMVFRCSLKPSMCYIISDCSSRYFNGAQ